ncbi:DUF397 domain-containing protein [Streptomyces brevispora]|uniref:DUF397 domain-containing protein n=1 Tax=Streptomyces brevispora TaxID=887462 RepID=UPI00119FD5A4|nr:DUF397 domain-containing protein [Streptomyces brevispora]
MLRGFPPQPPPPAVRDSDGGGTNCVEVSDSFPALVPVRDSKTPDGPALVFGPSAWSAFVGFAAGR